MTDVPQAAKTNLFVPRGSLISFAWVVGDYDMSGTTWTGECQIRQQITDDEVADTLDVTVSGQTVSIVVPVAKSTAWGFTQAVYGIEIVDDNDATRRFRIAQGDLCTDMEVVR